MENFNALLTLSELKTLYSGKPVGICPLYKGTIGSTKSFETAGNPVILPKYVALEKLQIEFSPKQAGTGDPSPENVRPISGWDSVKVTLSNESESHDYNIILPETIYGGTVDAVTGVGSEEWSPVIDLDATLPIGYLDEISNDTTCLFYIAKITNQADYLSICCSHSPTKNITNVASTEIGICGNPPGNVLYLRLPRTTASNISEFGEWLDEQKTAGTPVQVAYKLATPESFKVSQVSIPSLRGKNYFLTNGENMDIIYKETSFWGDGLD